MASTHAIEIGDDRYATVTIGDQIWLADNLRVDRLPDGRPLAGAYAYADDPSKVRDHGRLYTFAAVVQLAAVCPPPWRVATDDDWQRLEAQLGLDPAQQRALGWRGDGKGSPADALRWRASLPPRQRRALGRADDSPFAALPAGARTPEGAYRGFGDYAEFWTATALPDGRALSRALGWILSHPARGKIFRGDTDPGWALSVRLVRERDGARPRGPVG